MHVTGTLTATGAAINVPLGFKPKRVTLFNETTAMKLEFVDTMAAGKGMKTITAGTQTFISTGGISLYDGSQGPVALTGTLAVTAGSSVIAGTSTKFLSETKIGDIIAIPGVGATGIGGSATTDQAYGKVIAIASDTSLTCQTVFDYSASGKSGLNTSGIAPGFSIGTDAINTSTNALHYIAEGSN